MDIIKKLFFGLLFVFSFISIQTAFAAESTLAPHFIPPVAKPINVKVGLYLDDISNVNSSTETVDITGILFLTWNDPRLKFNPKNYPSKEFIYAGDQAIKKLNHMWRPYVRFSNAAKRRNIQSRTLKINSAGLVRYVEQFSLPVASQINVQKFPFDTQTLTVGLRSLIYDESLLNLLPDKMHTGVSRKTSAPSWQLLKGFSSKVEARYKKRFGKKFSTYYFTVHYKRIYFVFLVKVVIPLIAFGVLACALFWFRPPEGQGGKRIDYAVTLLLITIAFKWLIFRIIPSTSYITLFDWMIFFTFIMICAVIIILIIIQSLQTNNLTQKSASLNRYCELYFPLIYLAGILMLFVLLL